MEHTSPELLSIARRAKAETTATEAVETALEVAALLKSEPVRALLCEIDRLNYQLEYAVSEREMAICEFANGDELARYAFLGWSNSGYILTNVFNFLKAYLDQNKEMLNEAMNAERARRDERHRERVRKIMEASKP
jgi:hypothetical protein